MGSALDPVLYPPRQRLGSGLERRRGNPQSLAGRAHFGTRRAAAPRAGVPLCRVGDRRHRQSRRQSALLARLGSPPIRTLSVSHAEYETTLREDGAVTSRVPSRGYDVSRRSYDFMDPAGRALFLVDVSGESEGMPRSWPVIGNIAGRTCRAVAGRAGRSTRCGSATPKTGCRRPSRSPCQGPTIGPNSGPSQLRTRRAFARAIKVVPYLEWVLNSPDADRNHTQYNRLFAEIEYVQ